MRSFTLVLVALVSVIGFSSAAFADEKPVVRYDVMDMLRDHQEDLSKQKPASDSCTCSNSNSITSATFADEKSVVRYDVMDFLRDNWEELSKEKPTSDPFDLSGLVRIKDTHLEGQDECWYDVPLFQLGDQFFPFRSQHLPKCQDERWYDVPLFQKGDPFIAIPRE